MPRRTIQMHAANARRDLDPLPESTVDAANAIERDFLRIAQRQARGWNREAKEAEQNGELLDARHARSMREWHATLAAIKKSAAPRAPAKQQHHASAAGKEKQVGSTETIFARVSDAEQNGAET